MWNVAAGDTSAGLRIAKSARSIILNLVLMLMKLLNDVLNIYEYYKKIIRDP